MKGASLALALAPLLSAATHTPVPAVESKPHPCGVRTLPPDALCATYPVWEDRERKAGRKIGLNIVILPATGPDKVADPLFILAGGPGQAASDGAQGWALNRAMRAQRDIVMVDQRGTGGSNPLECDVFGDPPDLQMVVTNSFPAEPFRTCRARLEKVADLRFYTTALGMDDVDDVRQWLGYAKINIWSGSYGTQAAQVYLRRHGATVRSAVLLGVAPVDELIPLHHAWAGQRAVDALFNKCHADAECFAAFPNLRQEFDSLFERVRKGVEVEVRDPQGRTERVRPSVSGLAEGLRHFLYYDDGRSFPAMIHRAATTGDLSPVLQTGVTAELRIINILAMGMNLSVTCSESVPYIDDATLARETAHTFLGDLRVKEQRAACAVWVRGPVPKDVHELVRSDVPVLLISGARDSVTPPEFAERVAKGLSNSKHVVFPESSHGNFGPCGGQIISGFIERGSVQGLNTSCVAEQKPTTFVTK